MIEALRPKSRWVLSAVLISLSAIFLYINSPFLVPFILAGIFALGLNDFVTRQARKWKLPRGVVIFLVTLAGLLLFWAPLSLAVYRIITIAKLPENLSAAQLTEQLKILKNFTVNLVQRISHLVGIDLTTPVNDSLESLIHRLGELALTFSSTVIRSAPSLFFSGLIFLIFLIVLLSQSTALKNFVLKYSPVEESLSEKMIEVLKTSCSVTLFSTFIIGVIQASLVGLGSLIFTEGDFWLVMPITFVLAFIPVIGAGPVGFTLALLAFLGGRTGSGIGMLVVSSIVSTIDNFLKPLLIGGKDLRISPLLGFTSVLGAIITLGLPGLLIGPVILNIFVRTVPVLLPELQDKKQKEH